MSKEGKGGGKGKAAAGAGILVLLAAGLFKFQPFGLPFGFDPPGSGNDSSVSEDSGSQKPAATEAPEEKKEEQKETTEEATSLSADITVSGKEYLYQNRKATLEELIDEMKKLGEKAEVRIFTEDDYTANAMDALKKALDEAGLNYMVVNEKM